MSDAPLNTERLRRPLRWLGFRRRAQRDPIDQWFSSRGLALLLQGTPNEVGTSVRAAPAMIVLFFIAMLGWGPWVTTTPLAQVVLPTVIIVLASWIVPNVVRRRRPFSMIESIGVVESIVFVAAPVLLVAVSPIDVVQLGVEADETLLLKAMMVGATTLGQLLLLGLVIASERFGLITLAVWLARTMLGSFSEYSAALASSLPVSLGVVLFFYLNPGVWSTVGTIPRIAWITLMLLLLVLAALFLKSRNHVDVDGLAQFENAEEVSAALEKTPMVGAVSPFEDRCRCPVTVRQHTSVALMAILSQLVIAIVIALGVFALLLAIGYLAVDEATISAWIRTKADVIVKFVGMSHTYVITWQHVRVAGFLAAFTAFNYSLASATDSRLRQGTAETVSEVVRQAFAMRLMLLPAEQVIREDGDQAP